MANTSTQQQQPTEQEHDDVPAGMYDARGIEGSEQLGTASTGTEQVVIDLELLDLKRTVSTILPFTDAATPFSLERLKALGWEGGETFAGISKNVVKAIVKYETYDGRRRMKVDIFTGQGRVVLANQMNDQEKRAFFTRLNTIAKQGSAPKPAAGAQGGGGYPADWDQNGPAKPRVNLG